MKERIKYLDVAKFIGIFCIFLGHFSNSGGKGYYFVYAFHVPLFFFISGCSEMLAAEIPFTKYLIKNIKSLLIPCCFFVAVSSVLQCIALDSHSQVVPNILSLLSGCIRNRCVVPGAWFLTCLFVIRILFFIIKKVFKTKLLIFIPCALLFIITEIFPFLKNPQMVFNIDSACQYIIFYGLGYCCFDLIKNLFQWDRPYKIIICAVVGSIGFLHAAALFFGFNLLQAFYTMPIASSVCAVLVPMIIIFPILIASRLFEDVDLFNRIGRNTLFICGSEAIIKLLASNALQMLGLSVSLSNPLATYLYVFLLLYVGNKVLVPWEKRIFSKMRIL